MRLMVAANGNVGVGTTNPDGLQVNQAVSEAARGVDNVRMGVYGGSGGSPRLILEQGGTQWEIDTFNGVFRIFTPGTERLVIKATGEVWAGQPSRMALDGQGRATYA